MNLPPRAERPFELVVNLEGVRFKSHPLFSEEQAVASKLTEMAAQLAMTPALDEVESFMFRLSVRTHTAAGGGRHGEEPRLCCTKVMACVSRAARCSPPALLQALLETIETQSQALDATSVRSFSARNVEGDERRVLLAKCVPAAML